MATRHMLFKGETTGIDKTDQDYQNAQATQNIDISTLGKISTADIGFVKQNSTALANAIVSILQLGKSETIVHVNDL